MELTIRLLFKIVLALGLGGLIGIDRERAHKGYPAGIRTLAFISLLGMLTSLIASVTNNSWVFPFSIATIFLLAAAGYGFSLRNRKSFGLTTTIILLLTYFIGLISYFDDYQYLAIALSIITTLVLTEKERLHAFARKMHSSELLDALKFAIVAFIILPILPNQIIDPFGVINPYILWLLVVLILAISFAGYIASKIVGPGKGLYWSGALGGLVSSTAVTSSLSAVSKKNKELVDACAVGITFASSIMFIRVLITSYVVNRELAYYLAAPLLLSTSLGFLFSYFSWKKSTTPPSTDFFKTSPFNFIPAIKFTILLVIILIVSKVANNLVGESGTYITSMIAGFVDADAATISVASMSGTDITYNTGLNAVLIACLANTVFKLLLARAAGSNELFKKLLKSYAVFSIPLIIFIILTF